MHILYIVKPRLIVIYKHTLYREATPNHYLYTYIHHEATPNRDLYIYYLS